MPHASAPARVRGLSEQFLQACFGADEESRAAVESLAAAGDDELDRATSRLLPYLHRRWGGTMRNSLLERAHRTYLTTWRQNRTRMEILGSVVNAFEKNGIDCMLLKGAALALGYYRDYGARSMGDFDLLIHPHDIEAAAELLLRAGWTAEDGCSAATIGRQSRVRHAWQFLGSDEQNCDLHWRPLARCYSPEITEMFWQEAKTVTMDGRHVKIPCPTDQFFHVCVHAMHWEWTRNLYWIADGITVLREAEVDWERIAALAAGSNMQVQFSQALAALSPYIHCDGALGSLSDPKAPKWERREYELLQKPCPLGVLDSVLWHVYHFRRLRPADPHWRKLPFVVGFPHYLLVFLNAPTWRTVPAKLWAQVQLRVSHPRRDGI